MLELMKTFGRHNKHQKVVGELIHLADPQIFVYSGRSGKHTEKIRPTLPKPKAFSDMKHANCSIIH